MTIKYQAKKGELYFGSLQKVREGEYVCNCLHNTCAGWIIEPSMIFKLSESDLVSGEITIPELATDQAIAVLFIASIIERFPDAYTN